MSIIIPKLHLYGIILIIAIFIGMLFIYIGLKDEIKKDKQILLYYIFYISFSFIIGKLYTIIIYNNGNIITAGLSSYGGLLGVLLGAIIFERLIPLKGKLIKYAILSLPLVYSLSKIACLLSGCCSGIPYNGIFNIIYPHMHNIKQFPVQALEVMVFLLIFIICYKFKNKKYICYITIILSALMKFILDFLRYDHIDILITKNQYFSIFLIVVSILVFIINKYIEKKRGKV